MIVKVIKLSHIKLVTHTQGGVVFYVDETGYHGLVVALEDVEGSFVWGCSGTNINVPYINIGDGLNNSIQILNNCFENSSAASAPASYQTENYNDWYLPSKNEFYEIPHLMLKIFRI